MKRFVLFILTIVFVLALIGTLRAEMYYGTPSPELYPLFGTLIDFDDPDASTPLPVRFNDYAAYGVTSIKEMEKLSSKFFAYYAYSSQSSPNYVSSNPKASHFTYEIHENDRGDKDYETDKYKGNSWDSKILIEFEAFVSKVGIGIANYRGGVEMVSVFDSQMNPLEEYEVDPRKDIYVVIERDDYDIKYLQIQGRGFAIDDLQFDKPINIVNEGMVGIGTIEPEATLDVMGDIHASDSISCGNSIALVPNHKLVDLTSGPDDSDMGQIYLGLDDGYSGLSFNYVEVGIGTTTPNGLLDVDGKLVVKQEEDGGNVGIGTSNPDPGSALEVIGDTRINGDIIVTGLIDGYDISENAATWESDSSSVNELNTSIGWNETTNEISIVDAGGTHSTIISGFLETEMDTEAKLESQLTDVVNVYTDNDGDLVDDNLTDNSIGELSDVDTTGAVNDKMLKYFNGKWVVADNNMGNSVWSQSGSDIYYDNGNVGIGTTSPTSKLHVDGSAKFTDTLTLPGIISTTGSQALFMNVNNGRIDNVYLRNAHLHSGLNGGNQTITNLFSLSGFNNKWILGAGGEAYFSGNVGIGTTSPIHKLDVAGDINFTGDLYQNGSLFGSGNGSGLWTDAGTYIHADNATDVVVTDSGNVGIGSIDAHAMYSNDKYLTIDSTNSGGYSYLQIRKGNVGRGQMIGGINILTQESHWNALVVAGIYGVTDGATDSAKLIFNTKPTSGSATTRMTIKSNGNVGLGLPSPEGILHINGARDYSNESESDDVIITSSGNVGIGTTSPETKLDVEGTVQAHAFDTGDIVFRKDGEKLWRMFEDENGLYLESMKTGETSRIFLEKDMEILRAENRALEARISALEKAIGQLINNGQ